MNKKTINKIIIALFIIIFVVFIFLYFYIFNQPKEIKQQRINSVSNFLPFGSNNTDNISSGTNEGGQKATTTKQTNQKKVVVKEVIPLLRQVTFEPTAGYTTLEDSENTAGGFIRYTDRAVGHIYQTQLTSTKVDRLSNTTIPKITDAIWIDGDNFIARFLSDDLKTQKTFNATLLEQKDGSYQTVGSYMEDNIKDLYVKNEDLYLYTKKTSLNNGLITKKEGLNLTQVVNNPFADWKIDKVVGNKAYLYPTPSAFAFGYLFSLDIKTGDLQTLISDKLGGIFNISYNAKNVLISLTSRSKPNLYVYNFKNGEGKSLKVKTLASKCVWSSDNINIYCGVPNKIESASYPDDWYKGSISFSDSIYEINTKSLESKKLIDLSIYTPYDIDVGKLQLSTNERYLLFIDKQTEFLWALRLEEDNNTT